MVDLIPHPHSAALAPLQLSAACAITRAGARFTFRFAHAGAVLWPPAQTDRARTDLLWKTTCVEAFLQPEGQAGYVEFNFSPSGRWAGYGFESYRTGMRHAAMAAALEIAFTGDGDCAELVATLPALPVDLDGARRLKVGLTAVIETRDGALGYFALAHPSPRPDFHNAAGFALDVILD